MRLKSELYKQEQENMVITIINILELDDDNSITLYNLDNDQDKQKKLMNLIPTIRTFFSYQSIIGVKNPEKTKRPWLSIIKRIVSLKYKIIISDFSIKKDDKIIRTKKYHFFEK